MEGGCLCKAVRIRVNADELFSGGRHGHICHCSNCRKISGGIFGANLTVEETMVEFPKGKIAIRVYSDPDTLSGTPVDRHFCGTCGCPLFSLTPVHEGMITLNLGIYPSIPEPERENFVKDRQRWQKPVDGAVQYVGQAKGEKMPGSI